MSDNRINFEQWFKAPILKLQQDSEAGFIVVIVSVALLERYLREKSGLHEDPQVNSSFLNELVKVFPILGKDDLARKFWSVCRNGLMHQVTFKSKWGGNDLTIGLKEDSAPIDHHNDGKNDRFMISPSKFSNQVIATIENDFPAFEAPSSSDHPLSQKRSVSGYSGFSGVG